MSIGVVLRGFIGDMIDFGDVILYTLFPSFMTIQALMAMYNHFDSQSDLQVGALIHDGLHLKTTDEDKSGITVEMLRSAEEAVKNQTGYVITLEVGNPILKRVL